MNDSDRKMINHIFDLTYKTLRQERNLIETWSNSDFVDRMIELMKIAEKEIIDRSMK